MLLKTRDISKILKRNFYQTLNNSIQDELVAIAKSLQQPGKGILAADEAPENIGKRLSEIKIDNNEENRRQFRQLLFTTKDIGKYYFRKILFTYQVTF